MPRDALHKLFDDLQQEANKVVAAADLTWADLLQSPGYRAMMKPIKPGRWKMRVPFATG